MCSFDSVVLLLVIVKPVIQQSECLGTTLPNLRLSKNVQVSCSNDLTVVGTQYSHSGGGGSCISELGPFHFLWVLLILNIELNSEDYLCFLFVMDAESSPSGKELPWNQSVNFFFFLLSCLLFEWTFWLLNEQIWLQLFLFGLASRKKRKFWSFLSAKVYFLVILLHLGRCESSSKHFFPD